MKNLTKWTHYTGTEPNDNQIILDRTLWQLGLCEFSVKRSKILRKTVQKQLGKYSQIQEKLNMEIAKTRDSIEESRKNLNQAKIWKQNHVMYDLLANTIVGNPARKETNKMLTNLQTELKNLKEQSKSLEMKLDLRKKQFHVLVTSANHLRAMLEEVEDSNMNMSLIDITNSPEPEPMSE